MLGKLLKYELRSTSRIMLPLYPAVLIFALLNKISLFMLADSNILVLPRTLLAIMYGFLIAALFIMTIVLTLQRFYKNLLGDEGYLMFTLPVKTHELILSKFLSSLIWFVTSVVVALGSVLILVPDYSWIKEIPYLYREFSTMLEQNAGLNFTLLLVLGVAVAIVGVANFILTVYTSIALGHLVNKNRVLASFGAYIGVNIVMQIINTTFITALFRQAIVGSAFIGTQDLSMQSSPTSLLVYVLISSSVMCIAHFFITRIILKRKLNLE